MCKLRSLDGEYDRIASIEAVSILEHGNFVRLICSVMVYAGTPAGSLAFLFSLIF